MPAFCLLFLLLLLCFPTLCVHGAADGLALWLFTLVPTFFPFLFLSNLMVSCGAADEISRLCGRILCPLFRVSEAGAYILLMGFLCGYPMGAKLVAEFVPSGRISHEEGRRLLAFCNDPSPMFLMGFVLTDCMQAPYSRAGTLAMFYAAPILTGLFLSRFRKGRPSPEDADSFDRHTFKRNGRPDPAMSACPKPPGRNEVSVQKMPLMARVRTSMSDASATLLYLGGYVILFHIGSALILSGAKLFPAHLYPVFCLLAASLEMSGGAAYLAASGLPAWFVNLAVPLCVISGGICIMAQTAGLLSGTGLSAKPYILGKLMQMAIAAGIYLLLLYP